MLEAIYDSLAPGIDETPIPFDLIQELVAAESEAKRTESPTSPAQNWVEPREPMQTKTIKIIMQPEKRLNIRGIGPTMADFDKHQSELWTAKQNVAKH